MQAFPSAVAHRHSILMRVVIVVLPVLILLAMVVPTAVAKTTYIITDGEDVTVCTSYSTNVEKVLDKAGIQLDANDIYTSVPGDGVSEITIQRGQSITLYNCGKKMDVIGYNETVQALLDRLGVPSSGDFLVSADLNAAASEGMQIRVDHVLHNTEVSVVEIPYETVYCYDSDLAQGEQYLVREGITGQKQLIANVDYLNGEETGRTLLVEAMLCETVSEVVVIGTGENTTGNGKAPAIGDGVIVTHDGQILTYSSSDQFKATAYTHTDEGCDMTTATGTTVRIGTVAVDPKVIPYGTRMFIVTNDGAYIYGEGTAEDCGGAIKGNRLDLYFPTDPECWEFGVRMATVYFLD